MKINTQLWGFLSIITLFIVGASLVHWALGVFAYLFTGFLIWLICSREPSLPKMLFGWLPAMLADKPEWMD